MVTWRQGLSSSGFDFAFREVILALAATPLGGLALISTLSRPPIFGKVNAADFGNVYHAHPAGGLPLLRDFGSTLLANVIKIQIKSCIVFIKGFIVMDFA